MNFVYIAAPFFNKEQIDLVEKIENKLKELGIQYFSPRSEGVLIDMTPEEREKQMEVIFNSNILHINDCKCVLAVIDNWDTGTVFEIGAAYIAKKPIFTLSDNDNGLNVMIRQSVKAHNTNIDNAITNMFQYFYKADITKFDELTKDVT